MAVAAVRARPLDRDAISFDPATTRAPVKVRTSNVAAPVPDLRETDGSTDRRTDGRHGWVETMMMIFIFDVSVLSRATRDPASNVMTGGPRGR